MAGTIVFAAAALISTCREGSCHKSSSVGTHPASSPAFLGPDTVTVCEDGLLPSDEIPLRAGKIRVRWTTWID